ncbi:tyrosine-type recombinase/integrase [Piscinibacter sakaiensis]|uniref:Phage integrase n=1 Tax=Piscinibacter sakaiensis TaxID=1547922 RepID=A0A0K8P413_PISS1|nr:tyrosine-type recombinase/integrase [Piscinibacter sakaiensis]GAP37331.1 phage integrase [Piscinibacter sakaiensis]
MRTRTSGVIVAENGERTIDKQYKGHRIFERLGRVSQDDAEAKLRQHQARVDAQQQEDQRGADQLFRVAAGKYLLECQANKVRTVETIADHIVLLNHWVGDLPLRAVCNDSFQAFKLDRLAGRTAGGQPARAVKPATVNRALEVARTVLNRAARVWRTRDGKAWLGSAPLIELLDETVTSRPPRPISWSEQHKLFPHLPGHLERMALFSVNTGARDENVCGLRWEWERHVPDVKRSVFLVPSEEFKTARPYVLVLNDVAWRIVQLQRGKHPDYVFVYRREREVHHDREPKMPYRRIDTMNNTGFQTARREAGLPQVRVHDLRHTYGQRLRAAGVSKEDRAVLMGHVIEDMPEHYATATIARLIELANSVSETADQTTILRVVNG